MKVSKQNMANLRQKLDELTQCHNLERQLIVMDDLRKEFNHHIKLLKRINGDSETKYNCFMYALNVSQARKIRNALQLNEDASFGTKFIHGLINNRILSPNKSGTVIIYFKHNKPIHAGKFSHTTKRVKSKWGIGHLWKHDIFEVPYLYGNLFKFYDPVDPQIIIKEFQEYIIKEQNS